MGKRRRFFPIHRRVNGRNVVLKGTCNILVMYLQILLYSITCRYEVQVRPVQQRSVSHCQMQRSQLTEESPATRRSSSSVIIIIIIENLLDLGGNVALLMKDHHTMLLQSVSRLFRNVHYTRGNNCENRKV